MRLACAPPCVRPSPGGRLALRGFTAVGFIPGPTQSFSDPSALLFSLTNSLGRPEKLESRGNRYDVVYKPSYVACFGVGLIICGNADTKAGSETTTGINYAESASTGTHPMARWTQKGWRAAEVVAWAV